MSLRLPERESMEIEDFILNYGSQKQGQVIEESEIAEAYQTHIAEIKIEQAINSLIDEGKASVKLGDNGDYMISVYKSESEDNDEKSA